MDGRQRAAPIFGPRIEQGDGAFDLARPNESERPLRLRQAAIGNQAVENSGGLEHTRAAASVIVGARRRMVEVAGKDDFLGAVLTRNDSGGDELRPWRPTRLDTRAKPNGLTASKTLLPSSCAGR